MITSLLLSVAAQQGYTCAVMGDKGSVADDHAVVYAGIKYAICCAGCVGQFQKTPEKFTTAAKGKLIGYTMFDVVSGLKIDEKKLDKLASTDYKGIRYYFNSQDDLKAFNGHEKDYTKVPSQEVLFCPVMNHEVGSYAEAGAFKDVNGVRYYTCCGDCLDSFKKDPSKYLDKMKEHIQAPKVSKAKS